MEPSDFKAVRATVCTAGKFARPPAICVSIYCGLMYAVCVFAFTCAPVKEGC